MHGKRQNRRHQAQQRAAFSVFVDPEALPAASTQTPNRTVLQQASVSNKKVLKLSPMSQVAAEKENFDLVRKHLAQPYKPGATAKAAQRKPLIAKPAQNKQSTAGDAKASKEDPFKTPTRKPQHSLLLAAPPNAKLEKKKETLSSPTPTDNVTGTVRFRQVNKPAIDDLVQLLGDVGLNSKAMNSVVDLSPVPKRTAGRSLLQLTLPPPRLPRAMTSEPAARVLFAESLARAQDHVVVQKNAVAKSGSRKAKNVHAVVGMSTPPDMRQAIR
ncbi:hypothetical protein DL89DRAFT_134614 [Linderina pennispora]|uniref:Uncharacterized protein n=1 Tax=Linderina pennispora TaxID=61395 RepID=A0A1Y1WAW9_9FUNG|nr:uncharacterized protein DL89DRAFT_134614 [Linderina pennispora]ORX70468.1 hypothetical protein DL89DRAFT_134614 [Linderina pennispora]